MKPETAHQLLTLNRSFYDSVADPFAESRVRPQPGFTQLLDHLPQPCPHLLDVGCGEGRLGRFLLRRGAIEQYTGVDFSVALLEKAAAHTPGVFIARDLAAPNCLDGLGAFDAIACLAVLQHIPGWGNRVRLLQEMKAHVRERGRVILSTWQFMDSERQKRKIVDWAEVGLSQDELEPHDYLLTWQRGQKALRYVHLVDAEETLALAHAAGMQVLHQFRSDGKEEKLSLYSVLAWDGD